MLPNLQNSRRLSFNSGSILGFHNSKDPTLLVEMNASLNKDLAAKLSKDKDKLNKLPPSHYPYSEEEGHNQEGSSIHYLKMLKEFLCAEEKAENRQYFELESLKNLEIQVGQQACQQKIREFFKQNHSKKSEKGLLDIGCELGEDQTQKRVHDHLFLRSNKRKVYFHPNRNRKSQKRTNPTRFKQNIYTQICSPSQQLSYHVKPSELEKTVNQQYKRQRARNRIKSIKFNKVSSETMLKYGRKSTTFKLNDVLSYVKASSSEYDDQTGKEKCNRNLNRNLMNKDLSNKIQYYKIVR